MTIAYISKHVNLRQKCSKLVDKSSDPPTDFLRSKAIQRNLNVSWGQMIAVLSLSDSHFYLPISESEEIYFDYFAECWMSCWMMRGIWCLSGTVITMSLQ